MKGRFAPLFFVAAFYGLGGGAAAAQSPTASEIAEKLSRSQGPITRSFRNIQAQERMIDLNIQFAFDSADILPESQPILEQLAIALQMPNLAKERFTIEGHTDARGTEEYNLQLSLRRADTVVRYLASKGIDETRLVPEGKGFSLLANPLNPLAPENRRVRIHGIP
jgi:outer membrane protein OmpA-like peptidoglycan-associated protein